MRQEVQGPLTGHVALVTGGNSGIGLGRVDSCFVSAGVGGHAESFATMSDEEWHRVLRVNLDGAFHTAQEAVKQMVAQSPQGGSIVFTTSGSAFFGQQRGQHYGGSKAALNAMMKGIAVEHARRLRWSGGVPGGRCE